MTRVGTAGWSLPRDARDRFEAGPSLLARYATRFDAVEINSSFYRPHRRQTYARWAAMVSPTFRFSVKVPREITHVAGLANVDAQLDTFLEQTAGLDEKLGVILVQLPPKRAFDPALAAAFFSKLRAHSPANVACEPRHATWFSAEADALLRESGIARVAADPAIVPAAARPGGWTGLTYTRWHGSPHVYASPYEPEALARLARDVRDASAPAWCVFDNTMYGAATFDALALQALLGDVTVRW